MKKGIFIVFEGIDGAGKSTQAEILSSRLASLGYEIYRTAEPTTLESGKALRRVLSGAEKKSDEEICRMFVADRIAHNIDKNIGIEKALSEGKCIICDRYYYSTLAYQGSVVDYDWVRSLNIDNSNIRTPDICVFLDLTPEESLKRISVGRESVEIYENSETLTKVRASFMRVIDDLGKNEKIVVVNASRSIDEVAEDIFSAVSSILQ